MKRNGIDFFPFPTINSTALQFVEAKYKLRGVAIYVKILQKIFREEGYYFEISDDIILLFKQEIGVNDNIIPEVINECITRGLFDKSMYDKYSILTSDEIQKEYLNAVRKRKDIELKKEYLLPFAINFLKKAEESKKTAEEIKKTAEELNKGKESKTNKMKSTLINESDNTAVEPPCHSQLINEFKIATNKYVGDVTTIPLGVDMKLLTDKVKNSSFLMKAKNMTLKQCLNYYDKIIAGVYDNDEKTTNTNKANNVVITHTYSKDEMNSFYTNLDEINFDE